MERGAFSSLKGSCWRWMAALPFWIWFRPGTKPKFFIREYKWQTNLNFYRAIPIFNINILKKFFKIGRAMTPSPRFSLCFRVWVLDPPNMLAQEGWFLARLAHGLEGFRVRPYSVLPDWVSTPSVLTGEDDVELVAES